MHTLTATPARLHCSLRRSIKTLVLAVFVLSALLVNVGRCQTVTALYNFNSQNSSQYPQDAALVQGLDGELYGTTTGGGIGGSIFRVSESRIFTQLYSFNSTNSCCPGEGMTLASDGNFYGVAPTGGGGQNGVLFKITSTGTYTDIHDFTGSTDGGLPFAPPIQASDGNLYGMTENLSGTGSTVYQ